MKKSHTSDQLKFPWLEYSIPLLSFGGALVAILLWNTNVTCDFRFTIIGCVIASWVLAYLAWIRPRKDIVALSTPIYSMIFIAIPTDQFSAIVLEVLYAISLTILLVRLKYRFGEAKPCSDGGKSLDEPLASYIEQTGTALAGISDDVAHSAALVFVRFAESNYGESARNAETTIEKLGHTDHVQFLIRALGIIHEQATLLEQGQPRPETFLMFAPEDGSMLAKPLSPLQKDDESYYTILDNALLIVFSAAWNRSEKDRLHLLLCQTLAQKLLAP